MSRFPTYSAKLITLVALVLCSITPAVQSQQTDDPFLKFTVALIYRSSLLITWPKDAFESKKSPFIIGVYGNESLRDELAKSTEGRDINGHTIEVISLSSIDELKNVHVIYIDTAKINEFLAVDKQERENHAVLTVSDSSKFVRDGGVLRIFQKNSKPKLEVNVDALKRQNLKIDSQLLEYADVIRDN